MEPVKQKYVVGKENLTISKKNMIHFLLQKIKIFFYKMQKTQQKLRTHQEKHNKNSEHTKKTTKQKKFFLFSFFLFNFL
jgi:hypothetical protein